MSSSDFGTRPPTGAMPISSADAEDDSVVVLVDDDDDAVITLAMDRRR